VPLRKLRRHAGEALEVPRDLLLGRYPDFVMGGPLPRGDVPVFVFHSVEPESFGRKLRYLADNGYVTLSAEEYHQGLLGGRPFPDKAVLLTFDDGRGSLWSVGGPLLRRHGMRGVVFLVPGRTSSRPGPLPPTLDDLERGDATTDAVLGRESGEGAFLSWDEVEALDRSGALEFQSHTLTHARIHVSPFVAGFVTPESRKGYAAMDVPLIADGEKDLLAPDVPLGTPVLRSEPRTSEAFRFFEEPGIRGACVAAVAEGGGDGFFLLRDWEARLKRLVARQPIRGRLEMAAEREEALRRELVEARRTIEERTGRPVKHLCYPWHVSGATARRLALEAGYRTAFAGKVPGVVLTRAGGDPQAIARIGEDYVELLPGRGRTNLAAVLRHKWKRRLRGPT
jgi:peptidoglycan/xylan/chitin deacetylase (PgdA/CDA1 family)